MWESARNWFHSCNCRSAIRLRYSHDPPGEVTRPLISISLAKYLERREQRNPLNARVALRVKHTHLSSIDVSRSIREIASIYVTPRRTCCEWRGANGTKGRDISSDITLYHAHFYRSGNTAKSVYCLKRAWIWITRRALNSITVELDLIPLFHTFIFIFWSSFWTKKKE